MRLGLLSIVVQIACIACQCAPVGHANDSKYHPSPHILEELRMPDESGDVYTQARRYDGFNYRKTLAKAANGDSHALSQLFVYTHTSSLMGEGANTHIEVLGELLEQWGDKAYAEVLIHETPVIRQAVAEDLNEFQGHSGRPEKRFPLTYSICNPQKAAKQNTGGKGERSFE